MENRLSERVQGTERRIGSGENSARPPVKGNSARPVKARNRSSRSKSPRKMRKGEGGKDIARKQVRVQLLQQSRFMFQPGVLW
jgi:hypothetical protein